MNLLPARPRGQAIPAVLRYTELKSFQIFKQVTNFKFIYLLHFLADILGGLSLLSKVFQAKSVDVTCVQSIVRRQINVIKQYYIHDPQPDLNTYQEDSRQFPIIPDYGPPAGMMEGLRSCIHGDEYQGFKIERDMNGADLEDAIQKQKAYATAICKSLETRFEDSSILKHLGIFSAVNMPKSANSSKRFGEEELKELISFYGTSKKVVVSGSKKEEVLPLIDGQALRREYAEFKLHVQANWAHMKLEEIGVAIACNEVHANFFSNVLKLIQVALVQCASNAIAETVFSHRTAIKDKFSNRMESKMLDARLHVTINGVDDCGDFDYTDSIAVWKKSASRQIYNGTSDPLVL